MNRVVVFARVPRPALVASPFSPALPAAMAAELHAALLADTLAAVAGCTADGRAVAWAEGDPADVPAGFRSLAQRGEERAARLAGAFDDALTAVGDRVLVVGSDYPALRAAHLDEAFAALATHDVAFGPASQGGHWLVAMSRPASELFRGAAWNADADPVAALDHAAGLGLGVAMLTVLDALATPADLARLIGECAAAGTGTPPCGPHTYALLRAHGLVG